MTVTYQKQPSQQLISDPVTAEDGVTNGTCEEESALCPFDTGDVFAGNNHLTVKNEDLSEFSNSDLSLPEVCVSTNSNSCEEDEMNHEVQQAYKIFTGFLLDKHKGITRPFLHPIGHQEAQRCIEAVQDRGPAQLKQSMCLQRMEEKFVSQEYETITEFVADFRLMLENCYRYHGVDHWISKQAQKLEIMLEQKLTLLSRTLREKTTLAVTSRGRFCAEEERGQGGTSTRRRLAPRSLATITVGGHESIMVHTLRLEEQQRAKEEKRQRELEKKEAVETSAKEVDKWEHTLLSQASPHTVDALWEIPAIGHFLCLAQTALNLPEIVFFELERCLLMPRCSLLLSKIMSSLLSTSQRRASVNRRPPLPYRHWESELRQRVMGWYRCVGASHDQPGRAEQLGLCQQFFSTLGEVSPLEEKPFHLLPFYQRVWLLKGLCDHVYETQKSVQDAVLAQPIHECRESILGYDSKENAYIHFPHFCGADLRIYRQSPSSPPAFPFPSLLVKKVAIEPGTKGVTYEAERKKRRSPARSVNPTASTDAVELNIKEESPSLGRRKDSCVECFKNKINQVSNCSCDTSRHTTQLFYERTHKLGEKSTGDIIWTKKKKRKKKREHEQLSKIRGKHKRLQHTDQTGLSSADAAQSAPRRVSPTLVCSNLDELRDLISKTEDELDDLESTKKRLGRWYYRKEAVKELHSTLIRLLNELLPWEPRLVKAHQRNRFKQFLNNFIGAEAADETASTYLSPTHLRKLQVNVENGIDPLSRPQAVSRGTAFVANSGPQARTEGISSNQSTDSSSSWAAAMPLQSPLSSISTILHPTTGLPKGYTPIPVLLAKSVGNKVTLMKRPADCAGFNSVDAQGRGTLVSPPTSVMDKAKISKTQLWPSSSQKDLEQIKAQRQQQAHLQLEVAPVTKALGTEQQTKPNQAVPKSPVQVVRRSPQVPGHQEGKDGNSSSTVGPSVNPGQTVMRQVVILTSLHQQQSKDIQVPVSQVVSPVCMSTDVPGFTIPENRIPVQPVAPLKNNMTVSNHSPSVSPCQQQGSLKTSGFKTIPICSPQTSTPPGVMPNLGSPSSAAPPQPIKNTDPKQELKTVCIRDSQSILVTTRGGNTGIVKVQTSSDGAIGSMSTSPVITISPQFKAFLVSKTSSFTSSFPLSTSPLQSPFHSTTTGSIPITGAESQTKGSFVALNQASNISACSTVPKMSGHLAPVTAASLVKSAVAVPSQSSTAVPQLLTQLEVTKTGLKRVGTDERAQVTKFILLTPSSSPTSSEAVSKITSPSKKTLSNSKVMLIGQPTVTSSITSIGSIPTQTLGTGASEQLLTTPFPNPTVKMGISPEQLMSCGSTEALTKVKNISLPSGGCVTCTFVDLGNTIGALSSSPSKRTPVSVPQPGRLPATVPGLLLVSNSKTNTTWSTPLASSLCTPSFAVVSQMASNTSTSVATTLSTGTKKSPSDMNPVESFSNCPAQLPITVQSSPAQRSTSLIHQQSNVQNDVVEDRFSLPNPLAPNTSLSSGTCAPSITSAAGTIQQRIVINTSAPLAAGTQIILNNTRFVVPSQGLGPGSHVLIISGPAPPQVPPASAAGTSASAPPQVANHMLLSGTPPTVAAPPIVNLVSRIQTLPVATVPPIGTTARTFETVPVGTTPSSSSDLVRTPAQPISSNNSTHPAVVSTDQTFDRTSTSGIQTSVASKLLISPDGAVLSTAQRQVSPAEVTTCSKPTGVLVVSSSSSSGTLNTHDSSLQHSWAK
uniref:Bromo domain-containing protein n=1 Tax=Cynoglossus semilaevis TaxID=244447 RepID=A0A3P8WI78_CYNSE